MASASLGQGWAENPSWQIASNNAPGVLCSPRWQFTLALGRRFALDAIRMYRPASPGAKPPTGKDREQKKMLVGSNGSKGRVAYTDPYVVAERSSSAHTQHKP